MFGSWGPGEEGVKGVMRGGEMMVEEGDDGRGG